jgi:hypothetical protein
LPAAAAAVTSTTHQGARRIARRIDSFSSAARIGGHYEL